MKIVSYFIALVLAVVGIILALGVLLCPLYYVYDRGEPLYLLLFIITPIIAGIIVQVFIGIAGVFIERF